MSLPRTPENFPRMKHRARKRRGPRITLWDAAFTPLASTHTRFRPDLPRLGSGFSITTHAEEAHP